MFKEKKKNVKSLAETKTKLSEIQTAKKKKQETLANLSEQAESVATKNKVVARQEVNHLEVVVEEFSQEIKRMSSLEPRLRHKETGLVSVAQPKKGKNKEGTSRPKDVQKGSKLST